MSKQVFQTHSRLRWLTFQWGSRFFLFLFLFLIISVVITIKRAPRPDLPDLEDKSLAMGKPNTPVVPVGFNRRELKLYRGFNEFLRAKEKNERLMNSKKLLTDQRVRAGFYVDWDPQSYYSLQRGIDKMNMVIPEWFFIDPQTDTLRPTIDMQALQLMKQHHVRILPLINNISDNRQGTFDPGIIHRILHNKAKRERLVQDMLKYIHQYDLQGINIDFEEFREKSDEPIIALQRQIYQAFHAQGLLVTQDIMPYNTDYNIRELSKYNDYIVLMAYDQYWGSSVPGPVSSQKWIEKVVDETAANISPDKLILGLAGYGYDWPEKREGLTVTYQQALATARIRHANIDFDNDSYNDHFSYSDDEGVKHQVYFTDAATNFNTLRFSDEYGIAGTALWRLGSEDERIWKFYNMDLDNESFRKSHFNLEALTTVDNAVGKPDYIGDGEILNVIAAPEKGKIRIETDSAEHIITEQQYLQLPTKYVIRKFGNVKKQVMLTFDDGPDPEYTPRILDILKSEKVPAVFFVVGMQAEENLPLLKRIYREGHEIGNHTFTHPNMALVSEDRARSEMETTRLLIETVTGRSTVLFRAPYNADSEPSSEVELRPISLSKDQNYYTVGESIDPNDWEAGTNADSIYDRTIRQYEANPEKGIILLHDAGGNRQATVEALPRIIHYFKQKDIAFTTVSGLLKVNKNVVMPVVHNNLVSLNAGIANLGYWFVQFLTSAFWVAIILGLIRIAVMAAMALIRRRKEKLEPPFVMPVAVPRLSIIVPAYNEEVNVVKTINNLLCQDYADFDIIVVDDGSKDHTYQKLYEAFHGNNKVYVYTKPNGGKASALNFGISRTDAQFVVCIDADTQLKTDALSKLMAKMLQGGEDVGAVAGNVKAGNTTTILAKWQRIEYVTSQNFDRRAFDLINGISVVPGAIGAFRKQAIEEAGGFTTDTLAEDCDLTIRIIRNGYRVLNCTEAIAVTEVPETLGQFMKQRFRWSYGIMQSFWKHRDACFNPKYKGLGLVSLPNILVFQILLPILAPLADLMLIVSILWSHNDPLAMEKIAFYYGVFMFMDILVSLVAFSFEKEKTGMLLWLLPQRFVYRQLMYVILFRAIVKAIKGEGQGWGVLKRTGNVKQVYSSPA